ncbi:MAG: peptide chain release factor N(5)-glutamine methyltransferase [Candidatus Polarisedimenticolaceae bacterium]|nr:peptide chain release factor N(5)-glutamine methyltransferase [Candidatus Polarisedimenticolaceae bacterium]
MSHCTIRDALQNAQQQLAALPGTNPRLEAEILLGFCLDKPRSYLYAWSDRSLKPDQLNAFSALAARRIKGEPIAYITGHREFWSLDLQVTTDTLIPRPETELLIELALKLIPPDQPYIIADLGTGSGAIAAAIATERPHCSIFATDVSASALNIAEGNFKHLKLKNIQTHKGRWCEALPQGHKFNLILSNPPYISDSDPHLNQGDLPWEPRGALTSGMEGLDDIRCIIKQTPNYLSAGGWLLLEHGYNQGSKVYELFKTHGFKQLSTQQDMPGQDRITMGQL